jgi:hypothetical protein
MWKPTENFGWWALNALGGDREDHSYKRACAPERAEKKEQLEPD